MDCWACGSGARQAGGALEITSGLGQGTRLVLRLPLNTVRDVFFSRKGLVERCLRKSLC